MPENITAQAADPNANTVNGAQAAGNQTANPPQAGTDQNGHGKPEVFPREYVEGLRRESAGYREKLREAEQKLKEIDDKNLSEVERAKKAAEEATARMSALENQLKLAALKAEIATKAGAYKLADPEAAWRLLDTGSIQFDADGKPANLDAAILDLTKRFPILVSQHAPNTPANNPGRTPDPASTLTREQIAAMSPEQVNQHWASIRDFLSRNK